jgi:hypothetical protein
VVTEAVELEMDRMVRFPKPFLVIWKFVLLALRPCSVPMVSRVEPLEFGKKKIFAYDAVGSRTDRTGKKLKGCCLLA